MRKTIGLLITSLCLVSAAHADEPAPAPSSTPAPPAATATPPSSDPSDAFRLKPWTGTIYAGVLLGASTKYTTRLSTGATIATSTDSDPASFNWGIEALYTPPSLPNLGVAFISDGAVYRHSDGSSADIEGSLLVMPRGSMNLGSLIAWAGVGGGAMVTYMGTTTATASGVTATVSSPELGPAFVSRIGVDLSNRVGVQLGYVLSTTDFSITAISSTATATLSGTAVRSWFSLGLRIRLN